MDNIKLIAESMGGVDLTQDQLQNELLLVQHHLNDAQAGLKEGDTNYVQKSLHDISEVVSRLSKLLGVNVRKELGRIH